METMGKVCIHCKKWHEFGEFYRHKGAADGRMNICKSCKKSYQKRRREARKLKMAQEARRPLRSLVWPT